MVELNTIYNEDCLVGMADIPDKSVDMILCDLPYGTTQNKWDSIIPLEPLWKQYERVIKDNGAIVLTAQTPFDKVLGVSNLKLLKYEWIWVKNRPTGFLNSKKMPLKKHENVMVFCKQSPTYNPQGLVAVDRLIRGTTSSNYGKANTPMRQDFTNYPVDVLEFDKDGYKVHPTQKPVALFEYLIKTYTNKNETVLDNCMGSGTTAIAAINTGRNYIGYELDPDYHSIAEERIANHVAVADEKETIK